MQFATLFILASAVLAIPAQDSQINTPANARVNYANQQDSSEASSSNRGNDDSNTSGWKDPNKRWKNDYQGNDCQNYVSNETEDIPEECLKSVFCDYNYNPDYSGCHYPKFNTVNKEELVSKVKDVNCIQRSICKVEDFKLPLLPDPK